LLTSLFADGDFALLMDEEPVIETVTETSTGFEEFTAEPVTELVVEPVAPVVKEPTFHESEWLLSQVCSPNTVLLRRLGNRKISVQATDILSSWHLMELQRGATSVTSQDTALTAYKQILALQPEWYSPHKRSVNDLCNLVYTRKSSKESQSYSDTVYRNKVYFSANDALDTPCLHTSKLYRFLQSMGFNVIATPSLEHWIPREYRRRVKDNTPFELPEIIDSRPLYEKCEEGTVLHCLQTSHGFARNQLYVVGDKISTNEDTGEEGCLRLHRYNRSSDGTGHAYNNSIKWEESEPMEGFFELADPETVIYDPEKCVPTLYKQEFERNLKRIEAAKWELFDHTVYDSAQAAIKAQVFDGKPMRMGKTRAAIAFLKLRNCTRTAFLTPKNGAFFICRELDALGIKDYKIIHSYRDLEGSQPWMEIIPYGWMKYNKDNFRKGEAIDYTNHCPYCHGTLVRRVFRAVTDAVSGQEVEAWRWVEDYGFVCRNPECYVNRRQRTCAGAAWGPVGDQPKRLASRTTIWRGDVGQPAPESVRGSGYVDYALKAHMKHVGFNAAGVIAMSDFKGRQCKVCGYVKDVWTPAPYRRLKKRYNGAALDEVHLFKSGSSDYCRAALGLHLPNIAILTGTLMPNDPRDAFWPLFRAFGNDTHRFPYARTQGLPYGGVTKFNSDFTENLVVRNVERENGEIKSSYKKRIPYLKNPIKFWQFMAPKMIRRSYEDPLVIQSLQKAGLTIPDVDEKLIVIPPHPEQAAMILASMQEFSAEFKKYREELAAKGTEDKTHLINSSYVISRMVRMRMGATVPDYINIRLAKHGMPPLYKGPSGGAKMDQVYNIVQSKCLKGEKVLILSDFRDMQSVLEKELMMFGPVRFDTGWDGTRRQEAFDQFNTDPASQVFIAGTRAIAESTDLAGGPDSLCRTVISTDLLWNPGRQRQAWARVQKPAKEKYSVEIYILILDASIDKHVYNTFYGKLVAAEQALDRRVVTKKARPFDVAAFVDQVLNDREKMIEYMEKAAQEELSYMPYLNLFTMEDRIV